MHHAGLGYFNLIHGRSFNYHLVVFKSVQTRNSSPNSKFKRRLLVRLRSFVDSMYILKGVLTFGANWFIDSWVVYYSAGLGNRLTGHHSVSTALTSLWCLLVVVFIHAYIGTFISFLSVPKLKPIISSLDDLPTSSLTWGTPKGTSLETLFMVTYKLS